MNRIEEIKSRLSIVELLNRLGLEINSSGFVFSIYKEEKTPSLKIYPDTNSFYDFSSNIGGDVVKFYADFLKIPLSVAIKELADMLNLPNNVNALRNDVRGFPELPERKKINYKSKLLNSEIELFEERAGICEFHGNVERDEAEATAFQSVLMQRREIQTKIYTALYKFCTEKGIEEKAFRYLTGEERGLTANTINKFRLFSIHSVKETVRFLRDSFSKDELALSGLFSRDYFIFTKHRIVIPYIEKGEIVYLRGRYFYYGESKPKQFGKYIGLNNFSTTLSPKRFYNVDLLNQLRPNDDLIICEGEFDCMLAMQYENNTLAISGVSNFPADKIPLLKSFNIYLLFDNDDAGKRAMKKIGREFKKQNQFVKKLHLKNYKDITELLK